MVRTYFGEHLRWDGEQYGDGRHPDLPWGYWLTSTGEVHGEPPLVDEDGRVWGSVREAFWTGRLGLGDFRMPSTPHVLDFMLSYLAVLDSRFVGPEERVHSIFRGDGHLERFVSAYMVAQGLLRGHREGLSPEGRAVLLMLMATRAHGGGDEEVGLDWIEANRGLVPHHVRVAAADAAGEREMVASRMRNRFLADSIDRCPAVKLVTFKPTARIPLRSTIWSICWQRGDVHGRDRFYLWLLERIDRWDEWTLMVEAHGVRGLTEHLLKLAFADRLRLGPSDEGHGDRDEPVVED